MKEHRDLRHDDGTLLIWTSNVGGMAGLWRLLEYLGNMSEAQRPDVVFGQEVKCMAEELRPVITRASRLGFRWFATSNVGKSKNAHGIFTLVRSDIQAQLRDEHIGAGCLLSVSIADRMYVNSYCPPYSEMLECHSVEMIEWLQKLNWQGKYLIGGDFNEEPCDSWISVVADTVGLHVLPANCSTSRWRGRKLIDFFLD